MTEPVQFVYYRQSDIDHLIKNIAGALESKVKEEYQTTLLNCKDMLIDGRAGYASFLPKPTPQKVHHYVTMF